MTASGRMALLFPSFPRRREPMRRTKDGFPHTRERQKRRYMTTKQPAVYILASRLNGTLYTGVTSDLVRRIYEHRNNLADGFTKRYGVHSLVYYELHGDMSEAIHREKQIKKWNRQWKVSLIEQGNPEWHDLWPEITGNKENGFPHTRQNATPMTLTCSWEAPLALKNTSHLGQKDARDKRARGNDRPTVSTLH